MQPLLSAFPIPFSPLAIPPFTHLIVSYTVFKSILPSPRLITNPPFLRLRFLTASQPPRSLPDCSLVLVRVTLQVPAHRKLACHIAHAQVPRGVPRHLLTFITRINWAQLQINLPLLEIQ